MNKLLSLYTDIELPLMPILRRMTGHGALVDRQFVAALGEETRQTLESLNLAIQSISGGCDPGSNKDVARVLFEVLGLTPTLIGKTGPVVDKYVLEDLDHPFANLVRLWRDKAKLLGTYIEPILSNPSDRVHGTFNQFVTRTGRLSSSGPNLQNQDPRIRAAYTAPVGGVLLCGDYSQQELRVLAHYSRDPEWLRWFRDGVDPHQETANVAGITRANAKVINFGIPYGAGVRVMGKSLPGGATQAAQLMEIHRASFPTLWAWIEHCREVCRARGYSDTLWGRRRDLPNLYSPLPEVQRRAERNAVNMPIQGTSADITKLAMVRVQNELDSGRWPGVAMILQVHDELVFECKDEGVALRFKPVLERIMEVVGEGVLDVPLKVDAHIGKTWKEAKG